MSRLPAVGFILACVFLDALGIGLIIPVLPRLIGTLAANADAQTSWYGSIMVSYGLMQFLSAPAIGALSDRIGRRPVLLTGILGLAVMMFVPAFTDSLWLILASRLVGGIMSSNIVVAQAYIADVTEASKRVAAFGRIGAIFGIAFYSWPSTVWHARRSRSPHSVSLCWRDLHHQFFYGLFVLPESLREPSEAPFSLAHANPFASLSALSREPVVLPILLVITLYTLSQSLVQCTWGALYRISLMSGHHVPLVSPFFFLVRQSPLPRDGCFRDFTNHFSAGHLITGGLLIGLYSTPRHWPFSYGRTCSHIARRICLHGHSRSPLQSIISRTGSRTTQRDPLRSG